MTTSKPTNIAASVRQRLLNKARKDQRPFAELLQYFAMERFLYRLSQSPHADKFVLKGALMLRAWEFPLPRATMDIDMLGRNFSNEISIVVAQVKDICITMIQPEDGLEFDENSIIAERITEDADYEGVRVRFIGKLDAARVICSSTSDLETLLSRVHREFPSILSSISHRLISTVTRWKAPLQKNLRLW